VILRADNARAWCAVSASPATLRNRLQILASSATISRNGAHEDCMTCEVDATCKHLKKFGVLQYEEKSDAETSLCSTCEKTRIDLH